MTFAAFEESVDAGEIVELFLFRYGAGAGEYYAYTSHTEPLTVATIDYEPVPIEREAIQADGTLDKSALKIRVDIATEIAEQFRVYPPPYVVSLVIAQGHVGDVDEEFLAVWAGRIVAATRDGSTQILTGEPISTSLRRPGLRRHYQYGCPLVLYSIGVGQCNADKASKTVSSNVADVDGTTVELDPGWEGAFAPAKFLGGMLEWLTPTGSTDRRTILKVVGDVLRLSGVPRDLAVSDPVDVILGCNHMAYAEDGGDCLPLHNNIVNYGGCRWIPLKNPIGTYQNYW